MKIVFLGTGTSGGVPMVACKCPVCHSNDVRDRRLRSSMLIKTDTANIVIDTSPDFRQQMLQSNTQTLDAILFTHQHRDHTGGLDDIRAFNFWQQKPMDIYATLDVQNAFKNHFDYIFDADYPGVPLINLHTISAVQSFEVCDLSVIPILVMHGNLPVLGFRFGDFTYITDAKHISAEEKEKIKGSKTLVLNALRHEPHWSHFSLAEALQLAEEMGAEHTYLTHISHQMGFYEAVQKTLPSNVTLAYDGLELEV